MRFAILLWTLAIATPAIAQQPAEAARAIERIMEADANRDGQVTRAELIGWRGANFTRFDQNGDGLVSSADIPAFLRTSSIGVQLTGMIRQFDANADGILTRAEFVDGPTPLFALADGNHDGIVSKAEANAEAESLRARGTF